MKNHPRSQKSQRKNKRVPPWPQYSQEGGRHTYSFTRLVIARSLIRWIPESGGEKKKLFYGLYNTITYENSEDMSLERMWGKKSWIMRVIFRVTGVEKVSGEGIKAINSNNVKNLRLCWFIL